MADPIDQIDFGQGGFGQGGTSVGGNPNSPSQGGQTTTPGGTKNLDVDTDSIRDEAFDDFEFGGDTEPGYGADREQAAPGGNSDAIADIGRQQRAREKQEAYEAKVAEMEATHATGEPYLWDTEMRDGEEIEIWKLVDGSTVYYDRDTETVVELEWPPGQGPVYQGNMMYNGEAVTVYELPDGTLVLVDENQVTVGYGDDIVSDTFHDPIFGEVYAIPDGPPDYDTTIYDADTGEVVMQIDTGLDTVVITDYADAEMELFSRYYPPGADYYLLIDETGAVIDQIEIEPEEVLDIFGVLTVYDDGNVVIDVGVAVLQVDIVGPEGGISFEVGAVGDLFEGAEWLGAVSAGTEWDEEGFSVWAEADILEFGHVGAGGEFGRDGFEVWTEIESDLEGVAFSLDARAGMTEDGTFFAGGEIRFDMSLGLVDLSGGVNGYAEVGPDGFEMTGGWDGKVGMLGAFVEGGQQLSLAVDKDGATLTGEEYRGVGIEGFGSVRVGGEMQLHTDGTRDGTSLTGGAYVSANDADGEEQAMAALFTELDSSGLSKPWVQDEHLDTGVTEESYDRHHGDSDPELPPEPDGSADYHDEFPEAKSSPAVDVGKSKAGQPRDVFETVAQNAPVPERTNDLGGDRAAGPVGFGAAGAASDTVRPTRTTERDLGLDDNPEPIGAARRPTQTTERDLGLDDNPEPIGAAGGNTDGVAGPKSNTRGGDPDQKLTDIQRDMAARRPAPPAPAPPQDKDKPEKPEIETKRDPDAPDPKPKGDPVDPKDLPPLQGRDGEPLPPSDGGDGPVLAGPGYDPTTPRPPINTERVWDGPGDDDDDILGGDKGGPSSGGRPGDGPPVIHLTDAAATATVATDSAAMSTGGADRSLYGTTFGGDVADGGDEFWRPSQQADGSADPSDRAMASPPPPPNEPDSELLSARTDGARGGDGVPFKSVADSVTARPRDGGGDVGDAADGEPGLPWKVLADSVTARPRDRVVDDTENDSGLDTDIPADDITTMVTGEGAGGGTDQMEVGRAPARITIQNPNDQPLVNEGDSTFQVTEPREPVVAQGEHALERVDGQQDADTDTDIDGGADADAIAQVETAIPAVSEPMPERGATTSAVASPEPEPEPMPEPEPIEHEPMPEPEPELEMFDDDVLDDDLDI